jgi:hypothetical protein
MNHTSRKISLLASSAAFFFVLFFFVAPGLGQEVEEHRHANAMSEEGLGRTHMDISYSSTAGEILRNHGQNNNSPATVCFEYGGYFEYLRWPKVVA